MCGGVEGGERWRVQLSLSVAICSVVFKGQMWIMCYSAKSQLQCGDHPLMNIKRTLFNFSEYDKALVYD